MPTDIEDTMYSIWSDISANDLKPVFSLPTLEPFPSVAEMSEEGEGISYLNGEGSFINFPDLEGAPHWEPTAREGLEGELLLNHEDVIAFSEISEESHFGSQKLEILPAFNEKKIQEPSDNMSKQRLSHIRVEKNRRKLMSEHFATLKDMLPEHFNVKNDQASILGSSLRFMSELQQLLLNLQLKKLKRKFCPNMTLKSSTVLLRQHPMALLASPTCATPREELNTSEDTLNGVHERHLNWTNLTYQVDSRGTKVVVTKLPTSIDLTIETPWRSRQLSTITCTLQSMHLDVKQMNIDKVNGNTLRLGLKTQSAVHNSITAMDLAISLHRQLIELFTTSSTVAPETVLSTPV